MSKEAVADEVQDLDVKRDIRLALFEAAIDRLLRDRANRDFVIFELRGSPGSYVQLTIHDGAVLGEVATGKLAPDEERVRALGCLGFEGGPQRAHFSRDHLPQSSRRLACLTELLLGAAYRPPADFDVTVVTRAMVEEQAAHLSLNRVRPRADVRSRKTKDAKAGVDQ